MVVPKFFSDLGETCRDLFSPRPDKDTYNLKQPSVEVQLKHSSKDISLVEKVNFSAENGVVSATLSDEATFAKFSVKGILNTKKQPALEIETDKLMKGLTLKFKTESLAINKITAKYRQDAVAVATDVEFGGRDSELSIKPSLVIVMDSISLGAECLVKPSARKEVLDSYVVGLEYARNDLCVTAKILNKTDICTLDVAYQVNSRALFGVGYTFNPSSGDQTMIAGGTYQFDGTNSLKAKVQSTGIVNTVLTHKHSDRVSLLVSSQFDATQLGKDTHKLGFKLVLGDC